MAYEEFDRFSELAALQAAALVLDVEQLIESFLELAGEARAVQAKERPAAGSGQAAQLGIRGWGLGKATRLPVAGCD